MRKFLCVLGCLTLFYPAFSQTDHLKAKNYPSLLWQITGNGIRKASYLFGTMHVSSKMAFHLSDSFYIAIRAADVVALETNPGTWQEDFSRYDLEGQNLYTYRTAYNGVNGQPNDYLTINTLKPVPYDKIIGLSLYSSPAMLNSFLYRSNSGRSSDFEEDTYLDLHIFQVGTKWKKKILGVEDFDQSMQLMKEAYRDAMKDRTVKDKSYDPDEEFSMYKLEEAYRSGNLDLLDTINKLNSTSAAFDEKFMYRRNEIQAHSIDSIIRSGANLFVGVGAAHLPGQRGVIELLRRMGYSLRPIKMAERNSHEKEEIDKLRVPVTFARQTSADGFFSVAMPGRLYSFNKALGAARQEQYADMANGSYYMVTRISTEAGLWGHNAGTVQRKIDSVLYENVPGKILSKTAIVKNGYKGISIINRTRRGDYQRCAIFITPFEILLFKMSGNGDYVTAGREADQFFNSIELKEIKPEWKAWSPSWGELAIELPHPPLMTMDAAWQLSAMDKTTGTSFEIMRNDIHNHGFVEEDSFDLALMEESFGASGAIDKQTARKQTIFKNYPALDAKYTYKDGSVALVRFLIRGPHYYTLVAHGKTENSLMTRFLASFTFLPYRYGMVKKQPDSALHFTVSSPVPVSKPSKLDMYPADMYRYERGGSPDDSLIEKPVFNSKLVMADSTGEKIYVSFFKPSRYYYSKDDPQKTDSAYLDYLKKDWTVRSRKEYSLPGSVKVTEMYLGDPKSSRMLHTKSFTRPGLSYRLAAEVDTVSRESAFITDFYSSFSPVDTVTTVDPYVKKSDLYFSDFFSADTILHKKAVKNIENITFDAADLTNLKKAIASFGWKEKKYLDVKTNFISKLASINSKEASDYLKELYTAANDTVELQYTILEALLQQKTAYAYHTFKNIVTTEPPVLNASSRNADYSTYSIRNLRLGRIDNYDRGNYRYSNGNFLDELTDTLQLTAGIIKDLLPLINLNDYERPVLNLMGKLADSNMLAPKDYETCLPKFLLEAKLILKKQLVRERSRAIKASQKDPDERRFGYGMDNEDRGNDELNLYAVLLLPFWDKSPAVPALLQQLLHSNDKKLQLNTALLLLKAKKQVPDSLLTALAKDDNYRYQLYTGLQEAEQTGFFPAGWNNHEALAKSKLLYEVTGYNKPDSIVYLTKLPVTQGNRSGEVYFFKYRQKKDDPFWKIGTVGLVPIDAQTFEWAGKEDKEDQYDFTALSSTKLNEEEPVIDQLKKVLKQQQYSKRKSAEQFYGDGDRLSRAMNSLGFRDQE